MPKPNLQEIVEYRGVEGLVAAEVLVDDGNNFTTGAVFAIAGVAEIQKASNASSDAHYYDNIPAIVIMSDGADTITISASAIPLDVLATLTGQFYDPALGAMSEGSPAVKYFALGYKTKKTNGEEVYVWRLKGTFQNPDQTSHTENNTTDANGQELVYTGISTTHKFTKTGKSAKALVVDVGANLADVSTFFDAVTTIDDLTAKTPYSLSITQATGTTVTVTRKGVALANNASIYEGDVLVITCTGGTLTVNSNSFVSGSSLTVSGNVTVTSTAS